MVGVVSGKSEKKLHGPGLEPMCRSLGVCLKPPRKKGIFPRGCFASPEVQGIEHPDECCLGSRVISKIPAQHTLAAGLRLHTKRHSSALPLKRQSWGSEQLSGVVRR